MQVRCPHCKNVFASERSGLQFCPACGQQIQVPGAVEGAPPPPPAGPAALPPSSAPPPGTRGPTAFERRKELGLLRGYWETWKESALSPEPFWRSVEPRGPVFDAILFGWISTVLYSVLGIPMMWANFGTNRRMMEELLRQNPDAAAVLQDFDPVSMALGVLAATVILYPLWLMIYVAMVHLGCMLFGAAKGGFDASVRAIAYGCGPLALAWFPVLGLGPMLYAGVLGVWGLARLHNADGWRAALGAFIIPVLLCCCCGGLVAAAAVAVGQAAAH
jgi:hypothetical protein